MSTTVYPIPGSAPPAAVAAPEGGFFSPLPRRVWALVEQAGIARRDTAVLGLLLDYKAQGRTDVFPSQETLAARLRCSVTTVRRSLRRLADAGLIALGYVRDALGRLRGRSYDLAGVLGLLPPKAPKMRGGGWGRPDPATPASPSGGGPEPPEPPKRQKCATEADVREDALEADIFARAGETERALIAEGVFPDMARSLVSKFGEEVCRRQLAALPRRKTARDRAAVLVASIRQGWPAPKGVPASAPPAPPPTAPRPAPRTIPGGPDPLDSLPPDERRRLEAQARAELERLPVVGDVLRRGRGQVILRARTRALLLAEAKAARGGDPP